MQLLIWPVGPFSLSAVGLSWQTLVWGRRWSSQYFSVYCQNEFEALIFRETSGCVFLDFCGKNIIFLKLQIHIFSFCLQHYLAAKMPFNCIKTIDPYSLLSRPLFDSVMPTLLYTLSCVARNVTFQPFKNYFKSHKSSTIYASEK